jgi:plastocyanin
MNKILLVVFILSVVVFSGCSTQQTPAQPTPTPSTGGLGIKKDIEISGFAFNPSTVTIPKGATVIWTNIDSAPHNILSDSGDEIKSDSFSKGETFAHTFSTPGTYDYHCGIHPSMKGKIIVE